MFRQHQRRLHRRRGTAAVLAMMYLAIFGSLGVAMAIVAQGNLRSADTHLKAHRAMATTETGLGFITYQLRRVTADVRTRDGLIDADNAPALWAETSAALLEVMSENGHNLAEPTLVNGQLTLGPISVSAGEPSFTITLTPHPLANENYGSAYYQRPPYNQMAPPVSAANPLDVTWVRGVITAVDGDVARTLRVDFKIDKKIRFAILAKSRVMIGRNVRIEGAVGSRFMETHLPNGHPIQIESDFRGLNADLDAALDALAAVLHTNDQNGDNRIDLNNPTETLGLANPGQYDLNGDNFIDDYDYFLASYDANGDGAVTALELNTASNIRTAQLLQLIDTFGDPSRPGYHDGRIDAYDYYSKIRGEVAIKAAYAGWNAGAADGNIRNYYQGPIHPRYGKAPLTFEADEVQVHEYTSDDFDVSGFAVMADGELAAQTAQQSALHDPDDPDSPSPAGLSVFEAVPYGAAYPYDYYTRPVYENMTFTNVTIPKGTNALFRNCTFIGCTFVETTSANSHANFNFAGTQAADGALVYPDHEAVVNGVTIADTKPEANNLRFDGCTFEGGIVSSVPSAFTHARNKINFTGRTRFNIDNSANLSASQKTLFKRSTILAPHYSVEMGTFVNPSDANETVQLSGTIVAGVIDLRGQVEVTGTILTTFEPISGQTPVPANASPQFNTTLGYFSSTGGDLEAEIPAIGVGVIKVRYDPTIPLPDGILGPIEVLPVMATYFEGGL